MNRSMVRFILGHVLRIEAVLMLLPLLIAFIYGEKPQIFAFFISILLGVGIGTLLTIKKPKNNVFYLKEGCVTTSLSWIVLSLLGCLPFIITGEIPHFANALFETISGFTTTGASILNEVESLSHATLMWRSFTHWIGGMGVLVFLLSILSMTGGSSMNLMKAESPGPSVGKLVPKIRQTARLLYLIYLALTAIEFVLLMITGMNAFDALNTAFATAGTGGFGIKNDSITSYNNGIQLVVTIFMILFGVNFNAYYLAIMGRSLKDFFKIEEVKYYFFIIIGATLFIFANIVSTYASAPKALLDSAFQVGSIITTTGFSTADFDLWNAPCQIVLVLLMFCGACAGSTGGGIKVSRILIALKTFKKELHSYIHPKSIKKIKIDGKPVEHEVVRSCNVYMVCFICLFILSVFLISFDGNDLVTDFTAVAATINNIGPGLSKVGPTQNFSAFSDFSKFVLMFDMLAGRLELFPMLILFHPTLWKEIRNSSSKKIKSHS